MPDHPAYCKKEAEISRLQEKVASLERIIMGPEGLSQTVPALNRAVGSLEKTVGSLQTGISGLLKFQENQIGQEKGKEIVRRRNRWIIGITVTIIGIVAGVLIGIHFG